MKQLHIYFYPIILIATLFVGCSDQSNTLTTQHVLGTWATGSKDTLHFVNSSLLIFTNRFLAEKIECSYELSPTSIRLRALNRTDNYLSNEVFPLRKENETTLVIQNLIPKVSNGLFPISNEEFFYKVE